MPRAELEVQEGCETPQIQRQERLISCWAIVMCYFACKERGKLMGKERRETGGRHFCELFLVLHEMNSLFMFFLLDCDCEISL